MSDKVGISHRAHWPAFIKASFFGFSPSSNLYFSLLLSPGFPPPGAMTLGPPPPSKVEDPPLDPGGQSNRQSDEGLEGANIFNNQMGPIGQSGPLSLHPIVHVMPASTNSLKVRPKLKLWTVEKLT